MRYLIDTHILMWLLYEPSKVKPAIRKLLDSADAGLYISIVSLWEIIVKASIGKFPLSENFLKDILQADMKIVDISLNSLQVVWRMPHYHSDPFDRMIIAQALSEKLTLITHDKDFKQYDAKIILA